MGWLTLEAGAIKVEKDITGKNLLSEIMAIVPKESLPEGFSYDDVVMTIYGNRVNLREFNIDRVFHEDVHVIFQPKGLDPITAIIIGISFVLSVTSLLLTPSTPKTQNPAQESPNNSFFGQRNTVRL